MKIIVKRLLTLVYKYFRSTALTRKLYFLSVEIQKRHFNSSNHEISKNGEKNVLEKILNRKIDLTVFDVGANVGDWSKIAATMDKNSTIHAFEVVPNNAQLLEENCRDNSNIVINKFGLLDEKGTIEINYYPESHSGSSMYSLPWDVKTQSVECEVLVGDDYVKQNQISKKIFLKIDAEGSDFKVIKGFEKSIQNGLVNIIQFEYNKCSILSKFLLKDFYDYLSPKGFEIGRIYPQYVDFKEYDLFMEENLLQANFLAVRKEESNLIKHLSK